MLNAGRIKRPGRVVARLENGCVIIELEDADSMPFPRAEFARVIEDTVPTANLASIAARRLPWRGYAR